MTEQRRLDDPPFGQAYVLQRVVESVDRLADKIESMATKAELGVAFARLDEMAPKGATEKALEKIDVRLSIIEKNQPPPWMLPAVGGLITIILSIVTVFASHFWK